MTTLDSYRGYLDRTIKPTLGGLPISQLRTQTLVTSMHPVRRIPRMISATAANEVRRAAVRLIIDTSRLADSEGSPEGPVRRALTNPRQGLRPQPVDRGYRTGPRGATSTAETPRA